jgi:hypothetical protein
MKSVISSNEGMQIATNLLTISNEVDIESVYHNPLSLILFDENQWIILEPNL